MLIRLIFLIQIIFLTSCLDQEASVIEFHDYYNQSTVQEESKNPYYITVLEGDNLYKISKRYEIGIREIILENHMVEPYKLTSGQKIRLPEPRFYTVKNNDTLYSIAMVYAVKMSKIIRENNLSESFILNEGMVIKLPSKVQEIEYYGNSQKNTNKEEQLYKSDEVERLEKPIVDSNKVTRVGSPKLRRQVISDNHLYSIPKLRKNFNKASIPMLKKYSSIPKLRNYYFSNISSANSNRNYNKSNYKLRFMWPIRGKVILKFGPKKGGVYNDGINISSKEGKSFVASERGEVVYSGNELRGYGNLVLIRHPQGYITAYSHSKDVLVKKGDYVNKGQVVGYVGSTGDVLSSQLHFSIRRGKRILDPLKYL